MCLRPENATIRRSYTSLKISDLNTSTSRSYKARYVGMGNSLVDNVNNIVNVYIEGTSCPDPYKIFSPDGCRSRASKARVAREARCRFPCSECRRAVLLCASRIGRNGHWKRWPVKPFATQMVGNSEASSSTGSRLNPKPCGLDHCQLLLAGQNHLRGVYWSCKRHHAERLSQRRLRAVLISWSSVNHGGVRPLHHHPAFPWCCSPFNSHGRTLRANPKGR